MGMMKDFVLLFCYNLSEIRFERDTREGDIQGGRKETDWGGCIVRNWEKWCGWKSQLVILKLRNNMGGRVLHPDAVCVWQGDKGTREPVSNGIRGKRNCCVWRSYCSVSMVCWTGRRVLKGCWSSCPCQQRHTQPCWLIKLRSSVCHYRHHTHCQPPRANTANYFLHPTPAPAQPLSTHSS